MKVEISTFLCNPNNSGGEFIGILLLNSLKDKKLNSAGNIYYPFYVNLKSFSNIFGLKKLNKMCCN